MHSFPPSYLCLNYSFSRAGRASNLRTNKKFARLSSNAQTANKTSNNSRPDRGPSEMYFQRAVGSLK